MRYLSEVFDFLRGNFLVQYVLLLLLANDVFNVLALAGKVRLETFGEEWCQVWVFGKASLHLWRNHEAVHEGTAHPTESAPQRHQLGIRVDLLVGVIFIVTIGLTDGVAAVFEVVDVLF